MQNKVCLLVLLILPLTALGQAGMWTWMKGDTLPNSKGHFGTQGVAAPANTPAALYEMPSWIDAQGNLWLFGGGDSANNVYGDLWMYNPSINEWTWVKGAGVAGDTGSYGIQGVASPANRPPARAFGSPCWTDLNGDFWLYGGAAQYTILNDLWKYHVATNEWTWIGGGRNTYEAPVYGTQGVPSPANTPGERQECSATWVDANGDLWLFGGLGYNDLWRYNIASNEWTWMNGPDMYDQGGVYGTLGVPADSNVPGYRNAYCSWVDLTGKFWLFGGTSDFVESYNDMWMYDPASNDWAWMGGTEQINNTGNFGAECTPSNNIYPPAMFENRARWVDNCGNLWLYGGGVGINGDTMWDGLWNFNPTTIQWTLARGTPTPDPPLVYGTQGVPAANNNPGGLMGCSSWFSSKDNYVYIFGGSPPTFLFYADGLWRFKIDSSCGIKFSLGNDTTYCGSVNTTLTAYNPKTVWSTGAVASQINITQPGTYWASYANECASTSDTIKISLANPPPPFSIGADTTYCNSINRVLATGNASTIWSTGITDSQITVTSPGTYWANISNTCGSAGDTIKLSLLNTPSPFTLGSDTTYCNSINRVLATGNAVTLWSTGVTSPQINVTTPGTYWANISNTCGSASDTIKLSLLNTPLPFNLGNDTTYCNSFSRLLSTGNANTLWSTGVTDSQITVNSPGSYWASISNSCGATLDTIQINVSKPPVFSLGPDSVLCSGSSFTLSIPVNATGYLWSTGETSSSIMPLQSGLYWAKAWEAPDCPFTDSINITVNSAPVFSLGPDTTFCSYQPYPLEVPAQYLTGATYHWQDSSQGSVFNVTQPGNYSLTISNSCGTYTSSKYINITYDECYVLFPNAFSPNGDGINDYFLPVLTCANPSYHLRIFNRWGEKVFEANEMSIGWDGTYNNTPAPIGVYVYFAEYYSKCENKVVTIKGSVTLLR